MSAAPPAVAAAPAAAVARQRDAVPRAVADAWRRAGTLCDLDRVAELRTMFFLVISA